MDGEKREGQLTAGLGCCAKVDDCRNTGCCGVKDGITQQTGSETSILSDLCSICLSVFCAQLHTGGGGKDPCLPDGKPNLTPSDFNDIFVTSIAGAPSAKAGRLDR